MTTDVPGYNVHSYTSTVAAVTFSKEVVADVLVIGGGGSGGSVCAGGGGSGAVLYYSGYKFSAGTYSFTVGAGGTGATSHTFGGDGVDSSITTSSNSVLMLAKGGGAGAHYTGSCTSSNAGRAGGSGGGAGLCGGSLQNGGSASNANNLAGVSGYTLGKNGHGGTVNTNAGGGGGAGTAASQSTPGDGIAEFSWAGNTFSFQSLFGAAYTNVANLESDGKFYVAGGGAGTVGSGSGNENGGKGGGGFARKGDPRTDSPGQGKANTGSGGGGGSCGGFSSVQNWGGNGGSGLILLRYSVCQPCGAGTRLQNAGASGTCTACMSGTYSGPGQSACSSCPDQSGSPVAADKCYANAGKYPKFALTGTQSSEVINLARSCDASGNAGGTSACSATLSSTISNDANYAASYGNNGKYTGNYPHTGNELNPYWKVDFGETKKVVGGRFVLTDADMTRMDNFKISIGQDGSSPTAAGNVNCYSHTGSGHTVAPYTVVFSCVGSGRYGFVHLAKTQYLHFQELEFYPLITATVSSSQVLVVNNDFVSDTFWGLSGSVSIVFPQWMHPSVLLGSPQIPPAISDNDYPVVTATDGAVVKPYAWYKFDSGGCTTDSSGNGFTLDSASGVSGTAIATCVTTTAKRGDSSSRFVASSGNNFLLHSTLRSTAASNTVSLRAIQTSVGITFAWWGIMTTSTSNWGRFLHLCPSSSLTASPSSFWSVSRDTATSNIAFVDSSIIYTFTGGVDGQWHHYALGISSGGVWTLYIDNDKKVCASGCSSKGGSHTNNLLEATGSQVYQYYLGANIGDSQFLDGNMDDFRIYRGVLTDAQVTTLYQGRVGVYNATFGSCPDSGTSCVAGVNGSKHCDKFGGGVCCGAGKYLVDGSDSACQNCPAGTYSTDGAGTSCTVCANGMWSAAGSDDAADCSQCGSATCATGYKRCVSSTSSVCCGGGSQQYFVEGMHTACQTCPDNLFGDGSGTTCLDQCPAGQYMDGTCKKCAAGTYRATPGAISVAECLNCTGSVFSLQGSSSCTPCTAACPSATGYYISATCTLTSDLLCLSCTNKNQYGFAYTSQGLSATNCTYNCKAGAFFNYTSGACEICPVATYQPTADGFTGSACYPCEAGTFSASTGATAQCANCPKNTFSGQRSTSCTPCATGLSSRGGASACTMFQWVDNYAGSWISTTTIYKSSAWTLKNTYGPILIKLWGGGGASTDYGEVQYPGGGGGYTQCLVPKANIPSTDTILTMGAGYGGGLKSAWTGNGGGFSFVQAATGSKYWAVAGGGGGGGGHYNYFGYEGYQNQPQPCCIRKSGDLIGGNGGSDVSGNAGVCGFSHKYRGHDNDFCYSICSWVNPYKGNPGATSADSDSLCSTSTPTLSSSNPGGGYGCNAGTASVPVNGLQPCGGGGASYASALRCNNSDAVFVSNSHGTVSTPAVSRLPVIYSASNIGTGAPAASTSSGSSGLAVVEFCPDNTMTYSVDDNGFLACACGAGRYLTSILVCQNCSAGTFSTSGAGTSCSSCVTCTQNTSTPGTCLEGAGADMSCQCKPGYYGVCQDNVGTALVLETNYSLASKGVAMNTYCAGSMGLCVPCPAGGYTDQTGATNCIACSQGSFTTGVGNSVCTGCDVGKFSVAVGSNTSSVCQNCSTGSYALDTGYSICTACDVGTYASDTGNSLCTGCAAGKFSVVIGSNRESDCQDCAAGFYSPDTGNSICTACDPGTFTATPGNSECQPCADEFFQPNSNSTGCLPCGKCAARQYDLVLCTSTTNRSCGACPITNVERCVLSSKVYYTSSNGVRTWAVPTDVTKINVKMWGGGGGGKANGLYLGSLKWDYTGNGGAGGFAECTITVIPGTSLTVSAGAGGVGTGSYIHAQKAKIAYGGKKSELLSGTDRWMTVGAGGGGGATWGALDSGSYYLMNGGNGGGNSDGTASSSIKKSGRSYSPDAGTSSGTCASPNSQTYQDSSTGGGGCDAGSGFTGNSVYLIGNGGGGAGYIKSAICFSPFSGRSTQDSATPPATTKFPGSYTSIGYGGTGGTSGKSGNSGLVYIQYCIGAALSSYNSDNGLITCYCPKGYLTDNNLCQQCVAGTYGTSSGATVCTECGIGTYSLTVGASASSTCIKCKAGTYSNATGAGLNTSCQSCAGGTYSSGTGMIAVENCTVCEVGKFASGVGLTTVSNCTTCASGFYSTKSGVTVCSTCTANCGVGRGTVTACNATLDLQCDACTNKNSYGDQYVGTGSSTTSCPYSCLAGSYTLTANCQQCAGGFYQVSGNFTGTACTQCVAGKASTAEGATTNETCVDCLPGQFQGSAGQKNCLNCTAGTDYADTSAQTACKPCTLTVCPNGQYQSIACNVTANRVCSPCLVGSAGTGGNCNPCTAGKFANVTGLTVCYTCEQGKYQALTNQGECSLCSAGKYGTGVGFIADDNCTSCALGSFSAALGATSIETCSNCPAGNFLSGQSCDPCLPGTFTGSGGLSVCSPCGTGTFLVESQKSVCTLCPAGTASNNTGMTSNATCGLCAAGFYAASPGQSSCVACEPGKFQTGSGMSGCDLCGNGTFSTTLNATSNASCLYCAPGRYGPGMGLTACPACDPGRYQSGSGLSVCDFCIAGTYNPSQASDSSASCIQCVGGKFQTGTGRIAETQCDNCGIGKYSTALGANASTVCTNCSAGTVQPLSFAIACTNCSAGLYQVNAGQGSCVQANAGYYVEVQGQTGQLACGGGTYSYQQGMTYCSLCRAGTYQELTVRTSSTDCLGCGAGKYSVVEGLNASSGCQLCANSTYSTLADLNKSSGCTGCPPNSGNQGGGTNLQSCVCNSGYSGVNGGTCTLCDKTVYCQNGVANPCPKYSQALQAGAGPITDCYCNAGYYGYTLIAGSPCAFCPANSYCPGGAVNYTVACPNGTRSYGNATSESACFCPANSETGPGAYDRNNCTCSRGYKTVANASSPLFGWSCQACVQGEICVGGVNSTCPPNSRANGVVNSHMDCLCIEGFYNESIQTETSMCRQCPQNSYCLGGGHIAGCPGGPAQVSPQESPSVDFCYCLNGTVGIGNVTCRPCSAGKYCILGQEMTCPENMNSPAGSAVVRNCSCNAGYYGDNGGACRACAAGKYNLIQGCYSCQSKLDSDCVQCSAGTYSTVLARNTTCDLCGTGKYLDLTGQAEESACKVCGTGTYQTGQGMISVGNCTACAAGSSQPAQGANASSACVACVQGTYQENPGQAACVPCVAGRYSNATGANQSSTCLSCHPGTWSAAVGANGSSACQACVAGYFSTGSGMINAGNCSECLLGTFASAAGLTSCSNCGTGQYSNASGMAFCYNCSANANSPEASTSVSACNCNAGYAGGAEFACAACSAGTFKPSAGYSQYQPASCPAGSVRAGLCVGITHGGSSQQRPVPAAGTRLYYRFTATSGTNTISFDRDTAVRVLVVGGGASGGQKIGGGGGAGAMVQGQAVFKAGVTYTMTVGAGGVFSVSNADRQGTDGRLSEIVNASVSLFKALGGGGGDGGISGAGRSGGSGGGAGSKPTTVIGGAASSTNIPSGVYGNKGGDASVTAACTGVTKCFVGAGGGGRGSAGGGATVYSTHATTGNGGDGLADDITGFSVIYAAGGGGGCAADNTNSGGFGGSGGVGGSGVKGGDASGLNISGRVNTGSGGGGGGYNGGTFSGVGSGADGVVILQWECPPGFVLQGDTCVCPPGGTLDSSGNCASDCQSCPTGGYSTAIARVSLCDLCGVGKFQTGLGMQAEDKCEHCVAGTFQTGTGMVSSGNCSMCGAGLFQTGSGMVASGNCTHCRAGTFQTGSGMKVSSDCTQCGAGAFQTGTGMLAQSSCDLCVAGTFQTGAGMISASNCSICVAGTYQSVAGAIAESNCTLCAAGTFQTGSGMASVDNCTACDAGTFTATDAPNTCTNCPSNSTSGNGSATCRCGQGYAGIIRGSSEVCTGCTQCDENADTFGVCDSVTRFDNVTCACRAGFNGTGKVCQRCAPCDPNAVRSECPYNSTADVSTCACNAGFYGDGRTCTACAVCNESATRTYECPLNSSSDTSMCVCNASYFGNGRQCQACAACNQSATRTYECPVNSSGDTSTCACNAGYFGNGRSCPACRNCSGNALQLQSCPADSRADVSDCACNAGYWGDGRLCTACLGCHANATQLTFCAFNSSSDNTSCRCNAGYFGDGRTCQACPVGTWSAGGSSCTPCGRGYYSTASAQKSNATCLPCPKNMYGPREASGTYALACVACPDFSTTTGTGTTSRVDCRCNPGYASSISETGGGCVGCKVNQYPSDDSGTCLPCPDNTASPANSEGMWRCTANAGYYARYTKTVTMLLEVPEEDSDPLVIEAFVRASAGGSDEVQVRVENVTQG